MGPCPSALLSLSLSRGAQQESRTAGLLAISERALRREMAASTPSALGFHSFRGVTLPFFIEAVFPLARKKVWPRPRPKVVLQTQL
jgi:hypothetical protein